jgi:hypothetical protein
MSCSTIQHCPKDTVSFLSANTVLSTLRTNGNFEHTFISMCVQLSCGRQQIRYHCLIRVECCVQASSRYHHSTVHCDEATLQRDLLVGARTYQLRKRLAERGASAGNARPGCCSCNVFLNYVTVGGTYARATATSANRRSRPRWKHPTGGVVRGSRTACVRRNIKSSFCSCCCYAGEKNTVLAQFLLRCPHKVSQVS